MTKIKRIIFLTTKEIRLAQMHDSYSYVLIFLQNVLEFKRLMEKNTGCNFCWQFQFNILSGMVNHN